MSLGRFYFYSDVLHSSQMVSIALQEPKVLLSQEPSEMEILYLLHGAQGSSHSWPSSSNVERFLYESERNMMIVMPTMKTNYYQDHKIGDRYYTYVAEELPKYIESLFNVTHKRENTYVAGLSMGGYGAMKIALRNPEKFCFGASFSGAVDMRKLVKNRIDDNPRYKPMFGSYEEFENSEDDLEYLLERNVKEGRPLPKLYVSCGTADGLLDSSIYFADKAKSLGYEVKLHKEKMLGHGWRFWDLEAEKLIRTLI
ncbi:MAG: prolyl oligopeptidase family serine peptidase [Clostridia bacterium]|nr:prolyl oligopeptidase family serine peptidase [Clostridia bacterium]